MFFFGLSEGQTQQPNVASSSLWEDVNESTLVPSGPQARSMQATSSQRTVIPSKYRTISLKKSAMESVLKRAPTEFTRTMEQGNVQIDLPLPDGGYGKFLIMESPLMPKSLAQRYPSIKTYIIQGIDDPTATGRVDISDQGFHATILSQKGSFLIDPYLRNNPNGNLSYYIKDAGSISGLEKWECGTVAQKSSSTLKASSSAFSSSWGENLKVYRLAVACTGEYSVLISGTSPGNKTTTLANIVSSVGRITAIYERDLAVRFILVDLEDSLIYIDPTTDPYTGDGSNSTLAIENQLGIDLMIGSSNYEFGHLYATALNLNGVSIGGIGILGKSSLKAKIVSRLGTQNNYGVPFDLVVAHEMGHGCGANHVFSFRYSGYGSEGFGTQVEPGSGSTIMSYAGITSANLQGYMDEYFNSKSLEQMASYISGASGPYQTVPNGNVAPVLNTLGRYTIPSQTPFKLSASATDSNGDSMTFCWEEQDDGGVEKNPTTAPRDDGLSPLFRSFTPTSDSGRIFPRLTYILNNNNIPPAGTGVAPNYASGEFLPQTTRTLKFRVTVRDNASGGGGVAYADTTVAAIASAGPFAIASFNTADRLVIGSNRTITWSVGNTGAGTTVNCANVKITLSLDGGQTFPVVIVASTPNTGSYSFVVPNNATTQGRIKVEAVGNIFFDINNANLIVQVAGASNDAFAQAKILGPAIPATATGTTAGATKESGELAHGSGGPFSSLWFRIDADRTGIVTLSTVGSAFDTVLAVYKGSELGKLTKLAANNDAGVGIRTSLLQFSMVAGTTYFIAIDGNAGATGTYVLTATGPSLSQAPANDMADFPTSLGNGFSFTQSGSILGATAQSGEPTLAGLPATRSVWFKYTAPANGRLVVDTVGSDFNSVLGVYSGTVGVFSSLKLLAANDDIATGNPQSLVSLPVTSGTTYIIKVDGRKSSLGAYTLRGTFSLPLPSCPAPATASFTMTKVAGTTTYKPSVSWSAVIGPAGYPVTAYEVQLIYSGQSVVNSGPLSAATRSWNGTALAKLGYTAKVRAIAGPITGAWREVSAKVIP